VVNFAEVSNEVIDGEIEQAPHGDEAPDPIYRSPASVSSARSVLALRTACPAPSLLK
jgi:hypothetical protein